MDNMTRVATLKLMVKKYELIWSQQLSHHLWISTNLSSSSKWFIYQPAHARLDRGGTQLARMVTAQSTLGEQFPY